MVMAAAVFALLSSGLPAIAKSLKHEGVTDSIVVSAPREAVWKAVTSADKFKASIKSTDEHTAIVEQTFDKIPFLGTVKTVEKVTVKPKESVSYVMIESNKFKAMSGCWLLTSVDDKTTKLQLTSYVDPGLPVPRFLINHFVKGKVEARLEKTKKIAEDIYANQTKSVSTSEKPQ